MKSTYVNLLKRAKKCHPRSLRPVYAVLSIVLGTAHSSRIVGSERIAPRGTIAAHRAVGDVGPNNGGTTSWSILGAEWARRRFTWQRREIADAWASQLVRCNEGGRRWRQGGIALRDRLNFAVPTRSKSSCRSTCSTLCGVSSVPSTCSTNHDFLNVPPHGLNLAAPWRFAPGWPVTHRMRASPNKCTMSARDSFARRLERLMTIRNG